jgi:hypothetical protein
MPLFREINLPLPLLIQAISLTGAGFYTAFARRPAYVSRDGSYTLLVPANASPRVADLISCFGVASAGLQSFYLWSSYMPLEENQFVYASVPVRLMLSTTMLAICLLKGKQMSSNGFWELLSLAIFDGCAATTLGFYLGRFDGIVGGPQRWL